ncbi:NAD(P)/FAD-dependent oxidoreductase [Propionicicella superfundia]|uniref:NAD(P)/FAD-dependent oxidoreductase n=1 Tax=Propionicicella superfundia TaxID=348582 RepID=UPI00146E0F6B|nr:FAD-dependent oxidoreductase [Propionicicella superfundia]
MSDTTSRVPQGAARRDLAPATRPELTADVAVIGAGILGTAIAAAAAARGLRTVVVDRLGGAGLGSTSASAGIIRVHAEDYASSVMAHESLFAWRAWRDHARVPARDPAAVFVECGTLVLDAASDFSLRIAQVMDEAQVGYRVVGASEMRERWPDLELGRFGGPFTADDPAFWDDPRGEIDSAVYTPSSGYVADPMLAAQNLAGLARCHGATFVWGQPVVSIARRGDHVEGLRLGDGRRIAAETVVNAAGPASGQVNALAGVGSDFAIRTTPVREELHHVPLPDSMALARTGIHLVDSDLGTNFRTDGKALLIGSNGAACDPPQILSDPDEFAVDPSRALWEQSVLRVAKRLPGLPVPRQRQGVAGVYDVSDDWIPIYDRTDLGGFYVAIGTSGHEFKTAPVTGDLLVGMILHGLDGHDQDTDPYQYVAPNTGRVIDTATFSRRRSPHTATGGRG